MKKIILKMVLVFLCLMKTGFSQNYTVSGYALDASSNGLAGVMIAIYDYEVSYSSAVITSAIGYYEFTEVPGGIDYVLYPSYFANEDLIITPNQTTLDFGDIDPGNSKTLPLEVTVSTPTTVYINPSMMLIQTLGSNLTNQNFYIITTKDVPPYVVLLTFYNWISFNPWSFNKNSETIDVTVDTANLKPGSKTAGFSITVMGSTVPAVVIVNVNVTCVLPKPNPYNPVKGSLTFFGNGIVLDDTEIKIYTINGELIKSLKNEFEWDGTNEKGKQVTNGIYIYTYESPKEKGVGKFTIIRR